MAPLGLLKKGRRGISSSLTCKVTLAGLQKLETAADLYLSVVNANVHVCSWAICLCLSNVFVSRCIKVLLP